MNLRLTDRTVLNVEPGYTVVLFLGDGHYLSIGSRFSLNRAGQIVELDPEDDIERTADLLNGLVGLVVTRAEATETGELNVEFCDSTQLRSGPDGDFEAWSVSGPRGFKVVCLPSGGLAIWSDDEC